MVQNSIFGQGSGDTSQAKLRFEMPKSNNSAQSILGIIPGNNNNQGSENQSAQSNQIYNPVMTQCQSDKEDTSTSQRLQDQNEEAMLAREQFAVSLRRQRKKEIISLKRQKMLKQQQKIANRLREQRSQVEQEAASSDEKYQSHMVGSGPSQLFSQLEQCGINDLTQSNRILVCLNEQIFNACAPGKNGYLEFRDIQDEQVQSCISDARNFSILLNMFRQTGTPFEADTCQARLGLRRHMLEIFDTLLRVNQFAAFITENCFESLLGFFAENLLKAKDWCTKLARGNLPHPVIISKETWKDLRIVLNLLNQVIADVIDEQDSGSQSLICSAFLSQENRFFQTLLVDLFKAFLAMKTKHDLSDSLLLKLVMEFVQSFYLMRANSDQIKLCSHQIQDFCISFFEDKDLVEKCQIDLLNENDNSQETDPDSDDEFNTLQSESEEIRIRLIQVLTSCFNTACSDETETKKSESKEYLAQISLPLIIKEMSQVNKMKSLQSCLEVLIQITATTSEELCSRIIEDQSVLRMLDSHLLQGSIVHKRLAYGLLSNFVLNTPQDSLKIIKDLGIMRRVLEGVHSQKEAQMTQEANFLLFNVIQAMSKQEKKTQIDHYLKLLKLTSPNLSSPTISLMQLLIRNLSGSHLSSSLAIQLITLKMLDYLLSADLDHIGLLFEQSGGIDPLENLQFSPVKTIQELASGLILKHFDGEEGVVPADEHKSEETKDNVTDGSAAQASQGFVI